MIERNFGGRTITVICDGRGCPSEALEVETEHWLDVLNIMRENEWHSRKSDSEEWEHFCPTCWEEVR